MRKTAALVATSVLAAGTALLGTAGPASAAPCEAIQEKNTAAYGVVQNAIFFDCNAKILQFDTYASVPIKAESWVRVIYLNGRQSVVLKYTNDNNGKQGDADFKWHFWNPIDRPSVRRIEFHTALGPDGNVTWVDKAIDL
ncbi:hypothetical protein [Paractinoplanes lichenicola]|uniref:Secreted protein n=1 Tax=Paractinoplanes lichenicola TaxID=2802976 RepID=A0ABS1W142_9ACTN|nr:hypothetical protein [Actinoplanes lichenicola]MBL7260283.1 hypothetical protein [Actinoplanes lichenicola]